MTTELIKISTDQEGRQVVQARELHEALEVETEYRHWFQRMVEYGFTEGKDFRSFLTESTGGRPAGRYVEFNIIRIMPKLVLCGDERDTSGFIQ